MKAKYTFIIIISIIISTLIKVYPAPQSPENVRINFTLLDSQPVITDVSPFLSWEFSGNHDSFHIQVSKFVDFSEILFDIRGGNNKIYSFSDNHIVTSGTYYVRISVFNGAEWSDTWSSGDDRYFVDNVDPKVKLSLSDKYTQTPVNFSWEVTPYTSDVENSKFIVYWSKYSDNSFFDSSGLTSYAETYSINLTEDTVYKIKLKIIDKYGNDTETSGNDTFILILRDTEPPVIEKTKYSTFLNSEDTIFWIFSKVTDNNLDYVKFSIGYDTENFLFSDTQPSNQTGEYYKIFTSLTLEPLHTLYLKVESFDFGGLYSYATFKAAEIVNEEIIDISGPVIKLSGVTDNVWDTNNSVILQIEINDSTGIKNSELAILNLSNLHENQFNFISDTHYTFTDADSGQYLITVTSYDFEGNGSEKKITLKKENDISGFSNVNCISIKGPVIHDTTVIFSGNDLNNAIILSGIENVYYQVCTGSFQSPVFDGYINSNVPLLELSYNFNAGDSIISRFRIKTNAGIISAWSKPSDTVTYIPGKIVTGGETVSIISPANNHYTNNDSIIVTVSFSVADTVEINGQPAHILNNLCTSSVNLINGKNLITASIFKEDTYITSDSISVYYQKNDLNFVSTTFDNLMLPGNIITEKIDSIYITVNHEFFEDSINIELLKNNQPVTGNITKINNADIVWEKNDNSALAAGSDYSFTVWGTDKYGNVIDKNVYKWEFRLLGRKINYEDSNVIIEIPEGSLVNSAWIKVTEIDRDNPAVSGAYQKINDGLYRFTLPEIADNIFKINLLTMEGTPLDINGNLTLKIKYADYEPFDGIVDFTGIKAVNLFPVKIENNSFIIPENYYIDSVNKYAVVNVSNFSIWALQSGVIEKDLNSSLNIFPSGRFADLNNITFITFRFESTAGGNYNFKIFSKGGIKVWEKTVTFAAGDFLREMKYDLKDDNNKILSSGTYLLYVETPDGKKTIKPFSVVK